MGKYNVVARVLSSSYYYLVLYQVVDGGSFYIITLVMFK